MKQSFCTIFSKYWIGILSILLFLGGIGIIIFSFCYFNLDDAIPTEDSQDINQMFTWVVVGLGGILIELSILGIILVWSKNKCISFCYSIQVIIMLLIFSGSAIGIYIGLEKANDKLTCNNLEILEDADKLFKNGSKLLCSDYCRCQAKEDWLQEYLDENNMNYRSTAGVVRVQDCKNYDEYLGGEHKNLIKSIKWIEENFECSGICTMPGFYLYSDINSKSKPPKPCLDSIKDKIKEISHSVSIVLGIIALILLITLICNFVVCCQGKKKKESKEGKYVVQQQQQHELYHIKQ